MAAFYDARDGSLLTLCRTHVPNDGRGTTFHVALRVETLAPGEGADIALV